MFILIGPEETRTIQRIPSALLFPAPGWPKGHLVLGYAGKGRCPMLAGNQCSIYEDRPRTCRSYDCRVFAATGVPLDVQVQPEIANRVEEWAFTYEDEEGRKKHRSLKEAAAYLRNERYLFPPGSIPDHPGKLAALAVRIHGLFSATPPADLSQAIMNVLNEPATPTE